MNTRRRVAVVVGSLRTESFNRKLAKAIVASPPPGLSFEIVEIGQLPLYNEDDDRGAPPATWAAFRQRVKAADAVLFVTPEYNRSVPAALKNAIDVGSRPYGQSAWNAKPGAVISVSPGAIGGFGANHCVRQSLVFLNVPVLQQPEAYIGAAGSLFDANGELAKKETREFLEKFAHAFADWITTNRKG